MKYLPNNKCIVKRHKKSSSQSSQLTCKICLKRFSNKQSLQVHSSLHSTSLCQRYSYKCQICQKGFQTQQNLKNHQNTHTGNKPYECKICNSRFAERSSLKKHQAVHSKECRYKCRYCDKVFTQAGSRQRHIQRFHKKLPPSSKEELKDGKTSSHKEFLPQALDTFLPALGQEIVARELALLESSSERDQSDTNFGENTSDEILRFFTDEKTITDEFCNTIKYS